MNSNIVKDQTLYAEGQIFDAVVIKNINILFDVSIRYILRKTEFNMYDLKCIFKDVYNECEALNIIPSPCNIFITVVDENENNFLLGYVPIEPCNIGKCLVNGLISISKKKFDSDIHQIQQKNRSEAANYNCKTSFLKKQM